MKTRRRNAYHLTELLTRARPGELARLHGPREAQDERNLVIGKAKAAMTKKPSITGRNCRRGPPNGPR